MPAHNPMLGASYGGMSPMSGYPQTQVTAASGTQVGHGSFVIDGTPMRVVTLAVAAAAGLWALRFAGFKFNVTTGVS